MAAHALQEQRGEGQEHQRENFPQLGFDALPLEVRLQCLANCDWQTLARASCVNLSTRALVDYLVRTPYWRTYSEEQPAVLCTDFATPEERQAACSKWAGGLTATLCGHGKPDICFVFVSSRSHANLPVMLRELRANLAKCTLLAGVVAPGVLGRDTERGSIKEVDSVERVGLVVSVLHLPPGSSLHAALINDGLTPNYSNPDWQPPEGELPHGPAKHTRTWLVLSDRHAHVDGVLQELGRRYPGEAICGGMGGGTDGTSSLLVGLPGRTAEQKLHAERFMVSQVSANVDLSPVGRVTLVQQLQNSISLATGADNLTWVPVGGSFTPTSALVAALQAQGANVAPRAPLFFGVRSPGVSQGEDDPCKMVMLQMHDPNNLMRTSGYVSVQHPVERGMIAAFYTPQPSLSRLQLQARLTARAEQVRSRDYSEEVKTDAGYLGSVSSDSIHMVLDVKPAPVYGCLLFPCVAKGQRYYDEADVETQMVQSNFPGAAMCGFFCNGEIGPSPPDELAPGEAQEARMMGYSTVVCMLKLSPAPPPPADWAR
ncbi:expressed protein [Chlorella variabilis]|uniref:Expressed protein n=1 Tax=Chlorella variabilis TaxID=554065 RepID=E1Z3S3_CHLVA|nr:expressed protein [Chlorella variabilis]EFN59225.1 expressed protein [Chlorella variabilis]|eukprot:XP_005851327.1 expressed protein [Chlorella variabilis]